MFFRVCVCVCVFVCVCTIVSISFVYICIQYLPFLTTVRNSRLISICPFLFREKFKASDHRQVSVGHREESFGHRHTHTHTTQTRECRTQTRVRHGQRERDTHTRHVCVLRRQVRGRHSRHRQERLPSFDGGQECLADLNLNVDVLTMMQLYGDIYICIYIYVNVSSTQALGDLRKIDRQIDRQIDTHTHTHTKCASQSSVLHAAATHVLCVFQFTISFPPSALHAADSFAKKSEPDSVTYATSYAKCATSYAKKSAACKTGLAHCRNACAFAKLACRCVFWGGRERQRETQRDRERDTERGLPDRGREGGRYYCFTTALLPSLIEP